MDHCFLTLQGGINDLVVRWLEIYKPTERFIEKPRTLRTPPLVSLVGVSRVMRPRGKGIRLSSYCHGLTDSTDFWMLMLIDVFLTSPFVSIAPLYPDGTKWERNLPVSPISTAYVMSRAILLYKTLLMQSYLWCVRMRHTAPHVLCCGKGGCDVGSLSDRFSGKCAS
jgi:hypothetical protein